MKVLILGLAFLTCFQTYASERCLLQAKRIINSDDSKTSSSCATNWGRELEYEVDSWQECYQKATEFAANNPYLIKSEGFKGSLTLNSCPIAAGAIKELVFVRWVYNDGYFFNSSGSVTKYSNRYTAPDKGDVAYRPNGQKLF